MYKGVLIFSNFLKYSMKMKSFGLNETNFLYFHRIFKTGGGGVEANPL